jgi:hypothetical protein
VSHHLCIQLEGQAHRFRQFEYALHEDLSAIGMEMWHGRVSNAHLQAGDAQGDTFDDKEPLSSASPVLAGFFSNMHNFVLNNSSFYNVQGNLKLNIQFHSIGDTSEFVSYPFVFNVLKYA